MQEDQERKALTFNDILAFAEKFDEDLMPSISNPDEVVMWIDKNKLSPEQNLESKTFLGIQHIRIPCSKEFAEACLNLREDKYKPPRSYFPIGGLNIGVGTNGRGNPYIRIDSSNGGEFSRLVDNADRLRRIMKTKNINTIHLDDAPSSLVYSFGIMFDSDKIV